MFMHNVKSIIMMMNYVNNEEDIANQGTYFQFEHQNDKERKFCLN